MAFSHLINCLLLAYGPYFVVYKAKNLFFIVILIFYQNNRSNYKVIYACILASIGFLLTQAFKMILLSVIIPTSAISSDSTDYNLFFVYQIDIKKNLFNIIDFVGIFMLLKYRWSQIDEHYIRIIILAFGWSLMDSICSNLFTFIMNASGDELNWNYMLIALLSNFEFLEMICSVSVAIQVQKLARNSEFQKISSSFLFISFVVAKFCILPTIISYQTNQNEGFINLQSICIKGGFSLLFLIVVYHEQCFSGK